MSPSEDADPENMPLGRLPPLSLVNLRLYRTTTALFLLLSGLAWAEPPNLPQVPESPGQIPDLGLDPSRQEASVISSPNAVEDFNKQLVCMMVALYFRDNPNSQDAKEYGLHLYNHGPQSFLLPADKMPWTGSYFAMEKGGIGKRWQTKEANYNLVDQSGLFGLRLTPGMVLGRLRRMGPEKIARLSAIEKYDIWKCRYRFDGTRLELFKRGPWRPKKPADWEGFCNGVCSAGILMKEPVKPVTVTNADGVQIRFEPNDIKALASASYYFSEKYAALNSPNFTDADISFKTIPNPAAFDWVLTHFLGELFEPFVVDIAPNRDIWNNVAIGYDRKAGEVVDLSPEAVGETGATKKVPITMTVSYADNDISDEIANQPTVPMLIAGKATIKITYQYELLLNSADQVVGGVWPPDTKMAPDLVWFPAGKGADKTKGMNPLIDFQDLDFLVDKSKAPR